MEISTRVLNAFIVTNTDENLCSIQIKIAPSFFLFFSGYIENLKKRKNAKEYVECKLHLTLFML